MSLQTQFVSEDAVIVQLVTRDEGEQRDIRVPDTKQPVAVKQRPGTPGGVPTCRELITNAGLAVRGDIGDLDRVQCQPFALRSMLRRGCWLRARSDLEMLRSMFHDGNRRGFDALRELIYDVLDRFDLFRIRSRFSRAPHQQVDARLTDVQRAGAESMGAIERRRRKIDFPEAICRL